MRGYRLIPIGLLVCFFEALQCFHMKASQIRISEASKAEYEKYLSDTCQDKKRNEYSVDDYLEWEQSEFLRSLRIALLPDTADGDFRTVLSTGLVDIVPNLFMVPPQPNGSCRRRNVTMDVEERVHMYTTFEDLLIDWVLSPKLPEVTFGPI